MARPDKRSRWGLHVTLRVVALSTLVNMILLICAGYLYEAPSPRASAPVRSQTVYLTSVQAPESKPDKVLEKVEALPSLPVPAKPPEDRERHDPRHDPEGNAAERPQKASSQPARAPAKQRAAEAKPQKQNVPDETASKEIVSQTPLPEPSSEQSPQKPADAPIVDAPIMNAKDKAWLDGSGLTALADADLEGVDAHADDYYENASRQRFINYYLAAMERQIMAFWPDKAWPKGLVGMIRFELDPYGRLEKAETHLPSGDPAFDRAMLQAVKSVQKYVVPDDPELAARYYSSLRFEYDSNDHESEKAPWESGKAQRLHRSQ